MRDSRISPVIAAILRAFCEAAQVWEHTRKDGLKMKIVLNVAAGLLVLAGSIWFLQGINVLPGSFMTGQIRWAVYGGLAATAGIGLAIFANRK